MSYLEEVMQERDWLRRENERLRETLEVVAQGDHPGLAEIARKTLES